MADPQVQATGEQLRHGGDLHRGERDVARPHRQDADTDPDPLGHRERRRGLGDPAPEPQVLDHPQLGEPERVGAPRVRQHLVGGQVAGQQHTDVGQGLSSGTHEDDCTQGCDQRVHRSGVACEPGVLCWAPAPRGCRARLVYTAATNEGTQAGHLAWVGAGHGPRAPPATGHLGLNEGLGRDSCVEAQHRHCSPGAGAHGFPSR